ncbi:MAG: hypothetical protein WC087_01895 [Candidatus Paceibacterota bacterium]
MSWIIFYLAFVLVGAVCSVDSARRIIKTPILRRFWLQKLDEDEAQCLLSASTATWEFYRISFFVNLIVWPWAIVNWFVLFYWIFSNRNKRFWG